MFFTALLTKALSGAPLRPASLQPGDYRFVRRHIAWLIRKEMKKYKLQGMSVAVVDGDQFVWSEGFGFADVEKRLPAGAETVYRVGSISKLFTATAVMQLAERGVMDIDAPLEIYLPEFSIRRRFAEAPITARSIMSHHSGLPGDRLKGMWEIGSAADLPGSLLEEYAACPPGRVCGYSNLAVSVLGHAVERITGKDFAAYLNEAVLGPLGMRHSAFRITEAVAERLARGYRKGSPALQRPLRDVAAGGLYANVLDLGRFAQMVFGGGTLDGREIIGAETLAGMLRPQYDQALNMDTRFGLGWALGGLDIVGGGLVAHHSGGTPLFHSQLILLPEHRLAVAVLANSAEARAAVDKVAVETMKLALEIKAGIVQPKRRPNSAYKFAPITPQRAAELAGNYATTMGLVHVHAVGRRVRARYGRHALSLIPLDNGTFEVTYRLFDFFLLRPETLKPMAVSHRVVDGREVVVLHMNGCEYLWGEKIVPHTITDAWRNRAGAYRLLNPDPLMPLKDVGLHLMDDVLVLSLSFPALNDEAAVIPLLPIDDAEAVTAGIGRNKGETVHVLQTKDGERLRYSGYEFQREERQED